VIGSISGRTVATSVYFFTGVPSSTSITVLTHSDEPAGGNWTAKKSISSSIAVRRKPFVMPPSTNAPTMYAPAPK